MPAQTDEETDKLARRLWSNFKPEFGRRALVRALAASERAALQRRAEALTNSLLPFTPNQRLEVDAAITAMLGGFRALQLSPDLAEITVQVILTVLRDFPAWAIKEGCRRIVNNEAGLDRRYAPNDTEIHAVVADVVRPYLQAINTVTALLEAPVEAEREREEIERQARRKAAKLAELKDERKFDRSIAGRPPNPTVTVDGEMLRRMSAAIERIEKKYGEPGGGRGWHVMTRADLDPDERRDLQIGAISRFCLREISEAEFRMELSRCGLVPTEIQELVHAHRKERRKGTPFE